VQESRHVTLNVQVPEAAGVPDMVAPVDVQLRIRPLQVKGVHCVFV